MEKVSHNAIWTNFYCLFKNKLAKALEIRYKGIKKILSEIFPPWKILRRSVSAIDVCRESIEIFFTQALSTLRSWAVCMCRTANCLFRKKNRYHNLGSTLCWVQSDFKYMYLEGDKPRKSSFYGEILGLLLNNETTAFQSRLQSCAYIDWNISRRLESISVVCTLVWSYKCAKTRN